MKFLSRTSALKSAFISVPGKGLAITPGEFAKALPVLKANLPPDLWQRHFSDIEPKRVGGSKGWLWAIIVSASVILLAAAGFWFFRKSRVRIA